MDGEHVETRGGGAGPDEQPTVIVLFGATGDLAARMVLPAVHAMVTQGLLPRRWALIGNGRGDLSHDEFREHVRESLTAADVVTEDDAWTGFGERLFFAGRGFTEDDPGRMMNVLDQVAVAIDVEDRSTIRFLHYLALPATTFAAITSALAAHDLVDGASVVFEKPYGTSSASFRELDDAVREVLDESQIYRIDHFLGKEAAQALHVLRFGNGLFSSIWNRDHVRAVQIDIPEELDVSDRAEFYDQTGALRDMIVTHLFQLAAEVAMEPPVSMAPESLREAREAVIAAFRPLDPDETVLGQFDGYLDVEGVADGSTTDTYAATRLWVDTDRWRDVPFLLRTGKQLAASAQQVSLVMRTPQPRLLGDVDGDNVLTFTLSGTGSVELRVAAKRPGPGLEMTTSTVALVLADVPGAAPLPPYARLLDDVLRGDRSLFTRPDGLAAAFAAIQPILDSGSSPEPYDRGTWGPRAAQALAEPDGWLAGDASIT